jgi:uncharacterized protein (DUF1015 family)
MLYSDPAFTAERLIFESGKPADLEITDEYDVVHKVWKLTDPNLINLIATAMQNKKLIIADGHHRYETSVTYMKERAAELGITLSSFAEGGGPTSSNENESPSEHADEPHSRALKPHFPEAAMMMTFVNMDAPGITILPTHRVVFGLENFSTKAFLTAAEQFFDILPLVEPNTEQLVATEGVAFLAATRDGNHLLTAKPEAIRTALKAMHPEISDRQASLDVVQLHNIVLEHLLNLSHQSIAELKNIRYIRSAEEAVEQVHSGKADIAFLIKPVTLDQLRDISLSGDVMPQKSTDFYPKLLSGLAIYALD